jgi:hypothetical protein
VTPVTLKGNLIKMKYTKKNAIGIRVRGGAQLMQVAMVGATTDLIQHWADSCIQQLENGEAIGAVKTWLKTQKDEVVLEEPYDDVQCTLVPDSR